MKKLSGSEASQLEGSIDKLFHYLLAHVKNDTQVTVMIDPSHTFRKTYRSPKHISVSPTLYTRIDGCHGAGNCCRVPFDLVYTEFDKQRIEGYDHYAAHEMFGVESASRFLTNRDTLLENLEPYRVTIDQSVVINQGYGVQQRQWHSILYVMRNSVVQQISGRKSCPYLLIGSDRYLCGVHPFKPLHCWYPHMTVRVTQPKLDEGSVKFPIVMPSPTVSIGRMQYGRNHKFGCPVKFMPTSFTPDDETLFISSDDLQGVDYFANQFESDISKLKWTSDSAESMGFTQADNAAVGIHDLLRDQRTAIESALVNKPGPICLWKR